MKYILSLILLLYSSQVLSNQDKKENINRLFYTCAQIRYALHTLGYEVVYNIAKARGASEEMIRIVVNRCRLVRD